MPNTLGDEVRAAGQTVVAAQRDAIAGALNAALNSFLGPEFRASSGTAHDLDGHETEQLSTLIYRTGQGVEQRAGPIDVDTNHLACAVDVTHTLDLEGLRSAYARVAAAKALRKTAPVLGGQTAEPTLGVVFAVDSAVPLEEMADELVRLNAQTPSDHWPDMVVIATRGQISYAVQWIGEPSISGPLLPPSPGAASNAVYAFYVVMIMSATGADTFSLAMHMTLGHLFARWSPGHTAPPGYDTIMDGVSRQGVTWTGYQYDLTGQLRPVPSEHYQGRSLPSKSVGLYPRGGKEPLAAMSFLRWQDGGVVLLRGKLPLQGMLVFLGGVIDAEAFRKIRTMKPGDLQVSSVLPISEHQYRAMLRNIQQRGGLDVRPDEGKFVIQKFADEGASSPFMARVFYAPLKLAESLGAERVAFEEAHNALMTTLMEIRDAARDVAKTWRDYARKVDDGSIVERQGPHITITENIDRQLGRLVSDFLTGATRSFKERMQQAACALALEIGFLYQKQSTFERGVAELEKKDPALAAYMREARRWGDSLVTTRNNLDHGTWRLQSAVVSEAGGRVTVSEPTIEGTPVTQWVSHMTDRVLSFVEDVIAHGIQKRLPLGITIAEIPLAQRSAEMPLRFKPTVAGGGLAAWQIYYHVAALNET